MASSSSQYFGGSPHAIYILPQGGQAGEQNWPNESTIAYRPHYFSTTADSYATVGSELSKMAKQPGILRPNYERSSPWQPHSHGFTDHSYDPLKPCSPTNPFREYGSSTGSCHGGEGSATTESPSEQLYTPPPPGPMSGDGVGYEGYQSPSAYGYYAPQSHGQVYSIEQNYVQTPPRPCSINLREVQHQSDQMEAQDDNDTKMEEMDDEYDPYPMHPGSHTEDRQSDDSDDNATVASVYKDIQSQDSDSDYDPNHPRRRRKNTNRGASLASPQKRRTRRLRDTTISSSPKSKRAIGLAAVSKAKAATQESSNRRFICSFSHYGCTATFRAKNEWKRHLLRQHLELGLFHCDVGECNPSHKPVRQGSAHKKNTFNRKDLFTQHHKRLHSPWPKGSEPTKDVLADFLITLEPVYQRCWRSHREPPQISECGFCQQVFTGPSSWDERTEHVGKHFEKLSSESATKADSLCQEDRHLTQWALRERIIKESPGSSTNFVLVDKKKPSDN